MNNLKRKKSKRVLLIAGIATILSQNLYSANTANSGLVAGKSDHMIGAISRNGWTISQEMDPDGWASTGETKDKRISVGVESNYVNKTQGYDKFTGKTLDNTTGSVNASVSFGNNNYKRQLKNVENGIDDYDAVNVSQLNAVAESIKNSASPETYFHVNTADAKKPTEKPGNSGTGNANSNLGGIGDAAGATGVGATTAGINARAQGNNSVAIGKDVTVKADLQHEEASYHGTGSVAIGHRTVTDREGSVAIGHRTEATGWRSTAVGAQAKATTDSAVAIGNRTISSGWGTTAVGTQAEATGSNATAVGNDSKATGWLSAAFGTTAQATAEYSTALGTLSKSVARESSAVGLHALSAGHSSVATGAYSSAIGANSIATGRTSMAFSENTIATGNESVAHLDHAVAIGNKSISAGESSVTLGNTASALTRNSIALGVGAIAGASMDDGLRTAADEYFTVQREYTKLEKILAITSPNVNSYKKIQQQMAKLKPDLDAKKQAYENALAASVDDTDEDGEGKVNAVALGAYATASGKEAVAIGPGARATAESTTTLGYNATATAQYGTVVGADSKSEAASGIIFGVNSEIDKNASSAVVLGNSIRATKAYSVVIGESSDGESTVATAEKEGEITTTSGSKIKYGNYAGVVEDRSGEEGVKSGYYVSVGSAGDERQIKHVGAGKVSADSTDAINGSQLYATNQVVGNVAGSVKNVLGGDANLNPDGSITMGDNIGGTGKNTIDAAIKAAKTEVKAGTNVTVDSNKGDNGQTIYTVNAKDTTVSTSSDKLTIKETLDKDKNKTNYEIDLSKATKEKIDKIDKIETDSKIRETVVAGSNNVVVKVADKNNNTGGQEFVVDIAKNLDLTKDGSVTIGDTKINNSGLTVKDDKNETTVGPNGITITPKEEGKNPVSLTDKGLDNGGNKIVNVAAGEADTDAVNVSQLKDTIAANKTSLVDGKNTTVSGKGTANDPYKVNVADQVTLGAKDGADDKNGIDGSIGVNGKDGSSVVINGKDGSIGLAGKDGANALTIKGANGPAGVDGRDGETKTRIVYERTNPDGSKTTEQVATLNDGLRFTGNNSDTVNSHKLNTMVKVVGERTDNKTSYTTAESAANNIIIEADGKDKLTVKLAKDLNNINSISNGKEGDKNTTITLEDKKVNVGGSKITNVAAGEADTDAVNVSQLKTINNNITNVDGRINHIENRLDDVEDKMDKGFANLTAMATLEFMEIGINQVAVGAAVGTYGGSQAVAVGVQGAPTENTRIYAKASAAPGKKSKTAAGVGATWRFNLK